MLKPLIITFFVIWGVILLLMSDGHLNGAAALGLFFMAAVAAMLLKHDL